MSSSVQVLGGGRRVEEEIGRHSATGQFGLSDILGVHVGV
jgi:hypothetical protein